MSDPLAVILCGQRPQIAESVIASLKPEYEGSILPQPRPL